MAAYKAAVTTVPNPKPPASRTVRPQVQPAVAPVNPLLARLQGLNPAQAAAFKAYIGGQPAAAAPAGAVPGAVPLQLPSVAEAPFLNERNEINETANSQLAGSWHDQNAANIRYNEALTRMNRDQRQARTVQPNAMIERGLFNSGLQRENLGQLNVAQGDQTSDFWDSRRTTMNAFQTGRNTIEHNRARAIAANRARHAIALNAYAREECDSLMPYTIMINGRPVVVADTVGGNQPQQGQPYGGPTGGIAVNPIGPTAPRAEQTGMQVPLPPGVQGPQGLTGLQPGDVTGPEGLIPGQGPKRGDKPYMDPALAAWLKGLQDDALPPPEKDPYAELMAGDIGAVNAAAAAEEARINAHYDGLTKQLHSNFGSSDAGVRAEATNLYGELANLQAQQKPLDASTQRQIQATNEQAIGAQGRATTRLATDAGLDAQGRAAVAAAGAGNAGTMRANAANDKNYSARLNQLQTQAMNDRMSTAHVITTGSLNELRTILDKSLADAGLQKGDALAKIATARISETARIHNEYSKAIAKAESTATAGKPMTQAEMNAAQKNLKAPDYTKFFKPIHAGAKLSTGLPISHEAISASALFNSAITSERLTPQKARKALEIYITSGDGKDLDQEEKDMLTGAVDGAVYASTQKNLNDGRYADWLVANAG